jgi:hypothetical protein
MVATGTVRATGRDPDRLKWRLPLSLSRPAQPPTRRLQAAPSELLRLRFRNLAGPGLCSTPVRKAGQTRSVRPQSVLHRQCPALIKSLPEAYRSKGVEPSQRSGTPPHYHHSTSDCPAGREPPSPYRLREANTLDVAEDKTNKGR